MVAIAEERSVSTDPLLVSQVTQALRDYDTAGFGRVQVRAQHGVVTLSGSVVNWYLRSLAYQLAQRQTHGTRVVDALRVQPHERIASVR